MIEVRQFSPEAIKKAYDARSWIYSKTVARREHKNHLQAIDLANIQPGEKVLEVAVGPGLTFLELAKNVGKETRIYGIDLSLSMLQLTQEKMRQEGYFEFVLREADSRNLPFEDNSFDVLYNGYMLDLIPLAELPVVIDEFKRVLKPGGRLILLNMSKANEKTTIQEELYARLPGWVVLYFFGMCRPVLVERLVHESGMEEVSRTFLPGKIASEIVKAIKTGGL